MSEITNPSIPESNLEPKSPSTEYKIIYAKLFYYILSKFKLFTNEFNEHINLYMEMKDDLDKEGTFISLFGLYLSLENKSPGDISEKDFDDGYKYIIDHISVEESNYFLSSGISFSLTSETKLADHIDSYYDLLKTNNHPKTLEFMLRYKTLPTPAFNPYSDLDDFTRFMFGNRTN